MSIDDFEKPYISTLKMICRAIGYGRVMQVAYDEWRRIDPSGAISLGPCYGSLAVTAERPHDWMHHDMHCAWRQIGSNRGPCNCGLLSAQESRHGD